MLGYLRPQAGAYHRHGGDPSTVRVTGGRFGEAEASALVAVAGAHGRHWAGD